MTLAQPSASREFEPLARFRRRAMGSVELLLFAADATLAFLAILLSTEALNRFGVSSYVWYLVYAGVLARIALEWRRFASLLQRNILFLLYPAVCVISVLWSAAPKDTLVSGLQLVMTVVIAIFLGGRLPLRWMCLSHFGIITLTAVLSLLNWLTGVFGTVYAGSGGLLGIYSQKNALGQRCLIAILAGLALLFAARQFRFGGLLRLAVLGSFPVLLLALALSKSVTPILLSMPFIAVLLFLCCFARSRGVALNLAVLAVMAASIMPFLLTIVGIDPVTAVLSAFGKDSSLTGRTGLWDLGERVLDHHWLVGVGFYGFWKGPAYANMVFMAQAIGGEFALGFHNFLLEILVAVGVVGLPTMLVFLGVALGRAFRLWWRSGDDMGIYCIAAIMTSITLALLGPSLYRQHEFSVMLVAMLGVAAQEQTRRLRRQ